MCRRRLTLIVALTSLAGCPKPEQKSGPADAAAPVHIATVDAAALHKPKPTLVTTWGSDMKFSGPAAALHDPAGDCYLVSNIDGKPGVADKKGFISRLTVDAYKVDLKWIESGKNGVTLNSPKGMAITSDTLWVADIDTVRLFDRKTGKPTGEVPIAGASFLSGVAVGKDGEILVTDSGMKDGLERKATDAVYAIANDKSVKTIAKGEDLANPATVLFYNDKIWVGSATNKEIASLNAGKRWAPQQLIKGKLEGMLAIPSGDVFVSSWEGNAIYRGRPGEAFNVSLDNLSSPGALGYDAKLQRLLVPLTEGNELRAYLVP